MLTTMWKWWRTPMVPKSMFDELVADHLELTAQNARLDESVMELGDDNSQLQADLEQALLDRDAAILERDKAIGKFEYVESRNKELEKRLAGRDSYVRFLEDELIQHLPELEDEDEDEDEDDFDEFDDDDERCAVCENELEDCECGDDE